VQGILAAVGAYLLVLPLVVMSQHGWDVVQVACTLLTAVVVGASTPAILGRARAERVRS
jgi:branched-subunit amino acid ABC-type transport system permease component